MTWRFQVWMMVLFRDLVGDEESDVNATELEDGDIDDHHLNDLWFR